MKMFKNNERNEFQFNSIKEAINEIKNGNMIIIVDDKNRENEGDLYIPAEKATPEHINFMAKNGRGLICAPMTGEKLEELNISQMVCQENHTEKMGTAFTVSVDSKDTGTGISTFDRHKTIKTLINPNSDPEDLERPGHIFPLKSEQNGVLDRKGHTEAAVDLSEIADLKPAGVICEVMKENGEMARVPELMKFSEKHDLKIITIEDLIEYRHKTEKLIERKVETRLPTEFGVFNLIGYNYSGKTHLALTNLKEPVENPKVRIHSKCITGDALHSLKCDCGFQLAKSMKKISEEGGILLYLNQEGRGIGLINKLKAYELQENGLDTVEANKELGFKPDEREFSVAAQILKDLGHEKIKLLTNNPTKVEELETFGIDVRRESLHGKTTSENIDYLKTKQEKLGHQFEINLEQE